MKKIFGLITMLLLLMLSASALAEINESKINNLVSAELELSLTPGRFSELENKIDLDQKRYDAKLFAGSLFIGARRDETTYKYQGITHKTSPNWLGGGVKFKGFGDNTLAVYYSPNIEDYWMFDFNNRRKVRPRWNILTGAFHQFKKGGGGHMLTDDPVKTGVRVGVAYEINPQFEINAKYEINNIESDYVEDKIFAGLNFKL